MIPRAARTTLSALAAAAIVLLVVAATSTLRRPDRSGAGVLSDGERRALAAAPALRGADPAGPDPRVDLTDSAAVARAYLIAAHSARADDAGHTQRRGVPYAQPGSPAAVGVVVLDPPSPQDERSATVTGLWPAGSADNRRGYRAQLSVRTGPPGGQASIAVVRTLVVLAGQPDGRWLVATETAGPTGTEGADDPDAPAGED